MRKASVLVVAIALALVLGGVMAGEQSQSIKGTIKSIADDSKSLKLEEKGKQLTMQLSPSTKVRIDGQAGKLSDLKQGDQVECIARKTETPNTYQCSEIRRDKSKN